MIKWIIIAIFLVAGAAHAADPPMLAEYVTKIKAALPGTYTHIDNMIPLIPTQTLNKTACYYDGTKVLHEFSEMLYGDATWQPDLDTYAAKCNNIISARYIYEAPNQSGYTRFPHGLFNYYVQTGDVTTRNAFDALRDGTNWRTVNTANERSDYSREVAYALQTYTRAQMLGRPHANQATLIAHFRDMALSHLQQWHTGTFYPAGTINFKQAFMMGLTMAALIEYYENIERDSRIPIAVKYSLDDVWAQMWWPDVRNPEPTGDGSSYASYTTGYGAFFYWADYTGGVWVANPNKMPSSPDVNADTNIILAAPMMWYALYSGDTAYTTKAVDIWKGGVANAWYGPRADGGMFESSRYASEFIRWYRKSTGDTCSSNLIDLCETQSACTAVGGNWTGIVCQHAPVTISLTFTPPTGGGASPVNGVCGTSSGMSFISAPTNNLCSGGNATTISGTGAPNWTWGCNGISGGTSTSATACSATYSAAAPTCSDGIQNGTETGVDCGGSCSACVTPVVGTASYRASGRFSFK